MTKHILTFLLILNVFQALADEPKKVKFKTAADVFKALKASPDQPVQGPFELKIVAISKSGFNTRLHTKENPKDPDNIILELSPFMAQYYTKQFKTTLKDFFLNQVLSVNGKVIPIKESDGDQQQTKYVIKVYLANQLAHLQ